MAFKRNFKRGNSKNKSARITGLFRSKRKGLYVGTARPEDIEKLVEKIKAAMRAKKGLTLFLWKNDDADGPAFSLSADVAQDFPGGKKRRPIDEDDEDDEREPAAKDDDDEDEAEEDDPFA